MKMMSCLGEGKRVIRSRITSVTSLNAAGDGQQHGMWHAGAIFVVTGKIPTVADARRLHGLSQAVPTSETSSVNLPVPVLT